MHVKLARHEMLEFVLTLPERLKGVEILDASEFDAPEGKVEHLGEASELLQQLFSLRQEMNRREVLLSEVRQTSCIPSERVSLELNLQITRAQLGITDYMLDLALIEAFPVAYQDDYHRAVIGPNWQIYKVTLESLTPADELSADALRIERATSTLQ
jgi:hypothetical protein